MSWVGMERKGKWSWNQTLLLRVFGKSDQVFESIQPKQESLKEKPEKILLCSLKFWTDENQSVDDVVALDWIRLFAFLSE